MSATLREGRVHLTGRCHLEDAETLFGLLQENPHAEVDLTACEGLHGAVLQVLLVTRAVISGEPAEPFLRQFVAPSMAVNRGSNELRTKTGDGDI